MWYLQQLTIHKEYKFDFYWTEDQTECILIGSMDTEYILIDKNINDFPSTEGETECFLIDSMDIISL